MHSIILSFEYLMVLISYKRYARSTMRSRAIVLAFKLCGPAQYLVYSPLYEGIGWRAGGILIGSDCAASKSWFCFRISLNKRRWWCFGDRKLCRMAPVAASMLDCAEPYVGVRRCHSGTETRAGVFVIGGVGRLPRTGNSLWNDRLSGMMTVELRFDLTRLRHYVWLLQALSAALCWISSSNVMDDQWRDVTTRLVLANTNKRRLVN